MRRVGGLATRLERLRPHYVLGYGAALIGTVHGFLSISRARLPAGAEAGLWLASVAAVLVVAEAVVGRSLLRPGLRRRLRIRYIHLALMGGALVLIGLHAYLNGAWPR